METSKCEYIWLDGASPTQRLRSKTRILQKMKRPKAKDLPKWGFDGSSTYQAEGIDSDCVLKPVYITKDPLRDEYDYLVLCEVLNKDGSLHESNKRSLLCEQLKKSDYDMWLGFEQEYTLLDPETKWPYGWPDQKYIPGQGPYYCGIGAQFVYGRKLAEKHMDLCLKANLSYFGLNAEVMRSQWEFQIGYRPDFREKADPLTVSDQMWISRYLLLRVGEELNIGVSFDNKVLKGDWNGAGMHTNFSTKKTRDEKQGKDEIQRIIKNLEIRHKKHIENYGDKLEERLTGLHETCRIDEFKACESDRGASIRIPIFTAKNGHGYLEDRRPGANADPYVISRLLLETVSL